MSVLRGWASRTKALDSGLRCAHPGLSVRPAAACSDLRVHARASGCGLRPRAPARAYTHAQAGFTLIEVMAAFAIFAVLFGVMLQILSTSISNTRRSGDFTQAALLAQSQLDMIGIEALPQPGPSEPTRESPRMMTALPTSVHNACLIPPVSCSRKPY